jgi:hypothetical protein
MRLLEDDSRERWARVGDASLPNVLSVTPSSPSVPFSATRLAGDVGCSDLVTRLLLVVEVAASAGERSLGRRTGEAGLKSTHSPAPRKFPEMWVRWQNAWLAEANVRLRGPNAESTVNSKSFQNLAGTFRKPAQ